MCQRYIMERRSMANLAPAEVVRLLAIPVPTIITLFMAQRGQLGELRCAFRRSAG